MERREWQRREDIVFQVRTPNRQKCSFDLVGRNGITNQGELRLSLRISLLGIAVATYGLGQMVAVMSQELVSFRPYIPRTVIRTKSKRDPSLALWNAAMQSLDATAFVCVFVPGPTTGRCCVTITSYFTADHAATREPKCLHRDSRCQIPC